MGFFDILFEEQSVLLEEIDRKLQDEENEGQIIYPSRDLRFRAFEMEEVPKVVIIGQDPYPGEGNADGLAFSYSGEGRVPMSLQRIQMEILRTEEDEYKNADLPRELGFWKDQGVFLFNTALSVRKSRPGVHTKLWKNFAKATIEYISERSEGVIFLLWGTHASSFRNLINEKHYIIETTHPSPMAVIRGRVSSRPDFLGSNCFVRTNNILSVQNSEPINWFSRP